MTQDVTGSAPEAFEALLDAVRDSGRMVRSERGAAGAAGPDAQAEGYLYALELMRLAIDFFCDQDWSKPRFMAFSSPLRNHTGELAIRRIQGGANPDAYYDFAVINPQRTYRISGLRGNGCYLSFSFSGGADGGWPDRTVTTLNDTGMTFGPDGEFTIVVGPDAAGPNAVATEPDLTSVIVRQYFKVPPAQRRLTTLDMSVDPDPAFDRAGPADRSEDALVARSLRAAAAFIRGSDEHFPFPAGPGGNWFTEPLGYTGEAGALGTTDNAYCMGRWRLGPGEELLITTTPVACRYWSLQLWNHWGQSLTLTVDDLNYSELIVNDATADLDGDGDGDGSVKIVIGAVKPAEANWLNTFGWDNGTMIFRYLFPEAKPARPEITVRTRAKAQG